ncbi:MAG: poly-gamma-glutamate system protein [Acidobacteriota bacterium]
MWAVERYRVEKRRPYYTEKLDAASLAERAMRAVKAERLKLGIPIDPATDPTESGLLGAMWTPVTTEMGRLAAKQTTVNPNFAAVLVQMLEEAGAESGTEVAIGYSGSFPAMNLCVLAAVQTLHLRPLIISSCGASQWGANEPGFLWIDMEHLLYDEGIFKYHSLAASIGGDDDLGVGMDPKGREEIIEAIHRLKLPFIHEPSYAESVDRRMEIYRDRAGDRPIRIYVNVGGGASSLGRGAGQVEFPPGVVTRPPPGIGARSSVIMRFLTEEHARVIDIRDIEFLAHKYGLPVMPTSMPGVGEGGVFQRTEFNNWLALGILAVLVLMIWGFLRTEWGGRVFRTTHPTHHPGPPEPMI